MQTPSSSSAAPLPSVAMRFFCDFMSRLHAPPASVRNDDDEDDATLRRLSAAQTAALGPLLWQWMLVLLPSESAALRKQSSTSLADTGEENADKKASASPPSGVRTPSQVEHLFRTGLSLLVPSAATASSADRRGPPCDVVLPWQGTVPLPLTNASSGDSHEALVIALRRLSSSGPLFSSWCALCYACVAAAPNAVEGVAKMREGWLAATAQSSLTKHSSASASSITKRGRTEEASSLTTRGAASRCVDLAALLHLWRAVFIHCTAHSTPHPLADVWVAQWFSECCRVAQRGRDDGVVSAVPVVVLTRVMEHLCCRLREEMERAAGQQEHDRVKFEAEKGKSDVAAVSTASPLRIATLTGLALRTPRIIAPANTTTNTATSGSRGGRSCTNAVRRRKLGRALRRKRSADSDSIRDVSDEEEGLLDAEADAFDAAGGYSSDRDNHSDFSRFLASHEQACTVDIASAVLTQYAMTPLATEPMGEESRNSSSYAVEVVEESYLRQGKVRWWTWGTSRQQRQLMSEKHP